MFCCADCFSDKFLKSHIRAKSKQKGLCSFCKTKKANVVEPESLFDLFQPLFELYETDNQGKYLNELVQEDWGIFAIKKKRSQLTILTAITKNKETSKTKYKPILSLDKINIEQWRIFREELKHENRFFPKKAPDKDHLERLCQYIGLPKKECPTKFYRARINRRNISYQPSEMGKPSEKIVSNGRANPIGIPYLYIASDAKTAIAELRPHKGEMITVAELKSKSTLNLVDLRNPKYTINPFALSDEDDLKLIYKNMPYLTLLGEELSKPIIPREADLEYLPSQYLCELFKNFGVHGIAYKSSIAQGDNYVIFDDSRLEISKTETYKVTKMDISADKVKGSS